MTDVPNESSVITIDDLATNIEVSDEVLFLADGRRLSRDEAAGRIQKRLAGYFPTSPWWNRAHTAIRDGRQKAVANAVSQLIANALPPEALDDGVLSAIDLRPYMQYLADRPNASVRNNRRFALDENINVATDAAGIVQWLTSQEQVVLESQLALADVPLDQRPRLIEQNSGFDPARATPTVSGMASLEAKAGVEAEASALANWETKQGGILEDETNQPIFNMGDQEVYRATLGEEQSVFDEVPLDKNLYVTMESRQDRGGQRFKMMSVTQARQYLDTLDDKAYADWQRKLYQSGYFDKVGSGYIEGDRYDKATDRAWQLLLLESFKSNQPIMNTLARSYTSRKEQLNKRWSETMRTDFLPMADAISMDILGRRLRPEEYESVRGYIASLQQQRMTTGEPDWYTEDRVQVGFDERDLQRGLSYAVGGLRSEVSPEAEEAFADIREYWNKRR